jgi:hypothetical protein
MMILILPSIVCTFFQDRFWSRESREKFSFQNAPTKMPRRLSCAFLFFVAAIVGRTPFRARSNTHSPRCTVT